MAWGDYEAPTGPPPGFNMYAPPPGPPPGRHYEAPTGHYAPPPGAPPPPSAGYQNAMAAQTEQAHEAMQEGRQTPGQPYFEYSQCTGTRKALLIGINYFGSQNELHGCINDVHNVQRMLIQKFGYEPGNTVVLTDDTDPRSRSFPTHDNILRAMQWLANGARQNDSLFIHYSGHGTQIPTNDEAESDGLAEAICPVDFKQAGVIINAQRPRSPSHDYLVKTLPTGCRLTGIFDSCHSGSVMALPYVYSTKGTIKEPNMYSEGGMGLAQAGMQYISGNSVGALMSVASMASHMFKEHQGQQVMRDTRTAPADVISWSGCKDAQTSADSNENGMATGAMSYAFVKAANEYQDLTYQQLLVVLRNILSDEGYSQKPQLSACHPIDTNLKFIL